MSFKVTGAYVENGVHVISIQHYWWFFKTSKSQWAAPVDRIGERKGEWRNLSTCETASKSLVVFISRYLEVQSLIDKMNFLSGEKELDLTEPVNCSVCGNCAKVEEEYSTSLGAKAFQVHCHYKYFCMRGPRTTVREKSIAWWNVMNGHVMQDFVEVLKQPDPETRAEKYAERFSGMASSSWLGLHASKRRVEENISRLQKLEAQEARLEDVEKVNEESIRRIVRAQQYGAQVEDVEAELRKLKRTTT